VEKSWLSENPLTKAELMAEVNFWKDINIDLDIA
jgi:hypothetical protein